MQDDLYVIAGVNLRPFATTWLTELESGGGIMRRLLANGPEYRWGAHMMSANIGPQSEPDDTSVETMLFYAVILTYGKAGWPGADPDRFDGFTAHVERAFAYFRTVGEAEAARRIVASLIKEAESYADPFEQLTGHRREYEPAEDAYWDREMAELSHRDFRVAKLLDPAVDFDAMMMAAGLGPGEPA